MDFGKALFGGISAIKLKYFRDSHHPFTGTCENLTNLYLKPIGRFHDLRFLLQGLTFSMRNYRLNILYSVSQRASISAIQLCLW